MPATTLRGDGVAFPASTRTVNSTTIDVLDNEGHRIGYVTSISYQGNRQTQIIRELNAETAGRPLETALGVETNTLNLSGFALYDKSRTHRGSLINRCGSAMAALRSLQGQREAVHIVHRETHPTTGEVTVRRYLGCYFTSHSYERNIGQVVSMDRVTMSVEVVE